MKLRMFQVDAFAERVFEGNPAAVCPLEEWLDNDLLQAIAQENNLSETAFFVPGKGSFALRWFTPLEEVDLCGHATLASAHVIFKHLGCGRPDVLFETRSGILKVARHGDGYALDLPACAPRTVKGPPVLVEGLGATPVSVLAGWDYVALFSSRQEILALRPNFDLLASLNLRGVIVTAPDSEVDFVSRCFFPRLGVNEDPVTGSAHCQLAPFWSGRLGRTHLKGQQLSRRGGMVACQVDGNTVQLIGKVVDYMTADIYI